VAARLPNSGANGTERLARTVNTLFPSGDLTVTYQIKFVTDRASKFQTYFAIGPDTFTGGNDYYVTFDGNGSPSNNFAFGEADTPGGPDHYASVAPTSPSTGVWYRQGFVRSGLSLTYYYDLGGTGVSAKLTDTKFTSGAKAWASGHKLQFGNNNWSADAEASDCWLRFIKVWSAALSESDIVSESSAGSIQTVAGASNQWGIWPCNLDANDVSGNARDLTPTASVTFTADNPPAVALTGTATASITEADIVAGGKTVILTVSDDTYVPAAGTPTFSVGTTKGTAAADSAGGGGGRTGNGDLTCTFPSGYTPTAGHFALMIVYSDQGSGSTPTGWSAVTGSPFGVGTEKLDIFYKVLVGGESDPVTTISGSTTNISHCANMAIYTGVGSIGAVGTPSNGTGTPMTAAAITTTVNNAIVCACSGRGDNENSGSQTFGGSSTGVAERLDGGTAAGNDAQVSMADKSFATSGTSSGSASSTTSATDPWVSVQIELKPSTPFDNARSAIASGLDSAQSEAAGWDAKVKPNIPVANVVRTSDTVVTVTLQAQADYDITAQETITATVPASALNSASAVVATPTFTVAPVAAGAGIVFYPNTLQHILVR
jgi:hypothetical protein